MGACLLSPLAWSAQPYVTEVGRYAMSVNILWVAPHRAHVVAHTTIPASRERVWAVTSDYEHLAEFIPLMDSSKVVRREGGQLLLFQQGSIRLPFYHRTFRVTFRVQEKPFQRIGFEAIAGDFRIHKGSWRLQAVAGGTRLLYETTLEPAFSMPRWVMVQLERWLLKATFRAIIDRCLEEVPASQTSARRN